MDKKQHDQTHKSIDVFLTLLSALGVVTLLIFGASLYSQDNPEKKAKGQALSMGYFIWQLELNDKTQKEKRTEPPSDQTPHRSLASVDDIYKGDIGLDPWGHPYLFELRRDSKILYVWSRGPNGDDESVSLVSGFSGDDLGQVLDLYESR